MGRYSTDVPVQPQQQNYANESIQQQNNFQNSNWPTHFPLSLVSVDLNGTLIEDNILTDPSAVQVYPGVLDSIRTLRIKGHKFFILSDQPDISAGNLTGEQFEVSFNHLMQLFGQAGIMTIDGMLYNTSKLKQDEFAKPNTGMVKRAETEVLPGVKFKGAHHVGDSIEDLKMADRAGMKPVLVLTGKGNLAKKELEKHSNKELQKKTYVFPTFNDFVNYLTTK